MSEINMLEWLLERINGPVKTYTSYISEKDLKLYIEKVYQQGFDDGKEKAEAIWKPVVGYEDRYEVSNTGLVRNDQGCIMGQYKNDLGYVFVRLTMLSKGKRESARIHRLVARAFIPNPLNKPSVNHIDCNPANNHVSNLEWCTQKENIQHSRKLKRYSDNYWIGKRAPTAKLTDAEVQQIKSRRQNLGETHLELANAYGVSKTIIGRILRGKSYKNPSPNFLPQPPQEQE